MSATLAPTGGSLFTNIQRESRSRATRWNHTPVDTDDLIKPALRDALAVFNNALNDATGDEGTYLVVATGASRRFEIGEDSVVRWTAPFLVVIEPTAASRVDAASTKSEAVQAVRNLASDLGLPVKEVLAVAGINKRTFHAWDKPEGPNPRPASLGRLWELCEAVDEIKEGIDGSVAGWLHAARPRVEALRKRRFEALVDLAYTRQETHEPRPELIQAAVGIDEEAPIIRDSNRKFTHEALEYGDAKPDGR